MYGLIKMVWFIDIIAPCPPETSSFSIVPEKQHLRIVHLEISCPIIRSLMDFRLTLDSFVIATMVRLEGTVNLVHKIALKRTITVEALLIFLDERLQQSQTSSYHIA